MITCIYICSSLIHFFTWHCSTDTPNAFHVVKCNIMRNFQNTVLHVLVPHFNICLTGVHSEKAQCSKDPQKDHYHTPKGKSISSLFQFSHSLVPYNTRSHVFYISRYGSWACILSNKHHVNHSNCVAYSGRFKTPHHRCCTHRKKRPSAQVYTPGVHLRCHTHIISVTFFSSHAFCSSLFFRRWSPCHCLHSPLMFCTDWYPSRASYQPYQDQQKALCFHLTYQGTQLLHFLCSVIIPAITIILCSLMCHTYHQRFSCYRPLPSARAHAPPIRKPQADVRCTRSLVHLPSASILVYPNMLHNDSIVLIYLRMADKRFPCVCLNLSVPDQ